MKLVVDAPGKVNLCLYLGPLREGGRHELVTLIESVSLADRLTISTAHSDRVHCPGVPEPNLVATALAKLRANSWNGPSLEVEIEKRVPVAGGMGGGSADAAALLRAAQHLSPLPDDTLNEIAAELGADVPSQLEPGLTLATGAGERVQRLPDLPEHAFVIVPHDHQLSTAAVYAEADRLGLGRTANELATLHRQLQGTQALPPLVNDLQPAALSLCPEIKPSLETVNDSLVSGSGPTVFAIFWGQDATQHAQQQAEVLARRFPGAVAAVPAGSDAGRPRELA
jgi:4-diphosphocytidyl-2-C-methyl-D-erythritol kinase